MFSARIPHVALPRWRQPSLTQQGIGWASILIVICMNSMSTSFSKQLTTVFSPLSLLFISEFLTWSFTVLSFGFVPLVRHVLKLKSRDILPLLGVALCSSVIGPFCAFWGLASSKAMNAELLLRSDTLFILLLSGVVLKEKLHRSHAAASALIALGLVVIASRGMSQGLHFQASDVLLLFAAVFYSGGTIIFKKYLQHTHSDILLFVRTSVAICTFFAVSPFLPYTFAEEVRGFHAALFVPLIGYAFFSRFLSLFFFYEAMDRLPTSTLSLFLPLSAGGGVLFAWLYLGEPLRVYNIIGGILILSGALSLRLSAFRNPAKEAPIDLHIEQQNRHHL